VDVTREVEVVGAIVVVRAVVVVVVDVVAEVTVVVTSGASVSVFDGDVDCAEATDSASLVDPHPASSPAARRKAHRDPITLWPQARRRSVSRC